MRRIILKGLAPLVCLKFDIASRSRSPSAVPVAGNTLISEPDSVETTLLDSSTKVAPNETSPVNDPRCTCNRTTRNSAHNLHAMQNSTSGSFNVSTTRTSGW